MTYVREQTSAELAAHMRSLQAMPGWFDPLADRLWQEVQSLQRDNAALTTACRIAILALAHAAEKDATYQSAYEALDAVMVPGREA